MAQVQISSPFLSPEDDHFDLEAVTAMSSARCGLSKQWSGAYLGEKVTPPPPQSAPLDPTRSLWFESMQDMSGYVLSDTTLLPLDEQLGLTISTAQTENDIYVQNPGLPSPAEYILGDTYDDAISEEPDMFDNFNFGTLNTKTNECHPKPPIKRNMYDYMQSDQTRTTTTMGDEEKYLLSQKLSSGRPKKIAIKSYLEIIDSEEPLIKEDPDLLYCTTQKMDYDIKSDVDVSDIFSSEEPSINEMKVYSPADFKDMGVAEEVVVITEEEDKYRTDYHIDSVPSHPEEDITSDMKPKKEEFDYKFTVDPFSSLETVMDNLFNDVDPENLYTLQDGYCLSPEITSEDFLSRHSISSVNNLLDNESHLSTNLLNNSSHQVALNVPSSTSTDCQLNPKSAPRHTPLTLDIGVAKAAILDDKGISDTPELLEALKPELGKFDLIKFITTNGDPNNNAISPVGPYPKPSETPRKGKSHLSLQDLKQAQKKGRARSLSKAEDVKEEPLPSTSGTSWTGRPARQSATRFKQMLEEGLLSAADSRVSSDEEDEAPKTKRRRTTSSTSSRRRLTSESDRSSVGDDASKYRERRDRNNLSSKRSRQKRKMQHLEKQKELKELEDKNAKLRSKADELESVLTRVKTAWAEYLAQMRDSKDRGDEH